MHPRRYVPRGLLVTSVFGVLVAAGAGGCEDEGAPPLSIVVTSCRVDNTFDLAMTGDGASRCAETITISFNESNVPIEVYDRRKTDPAGVSARFPATLPRGTYSVAVSCQGASDAGFTSTSVGFVNAPCSGPVNNNNNNNNPDGAPSDTGAPDAGSRLPLGGTLRLELFTNAAPKIQSFASFYAPTTPAEETRVDKERLAWDNESSFPTIALGACDVPPYLGVEGDPAPLVSVGANVSIKDGASIIIPFQSFGTTYSAAGSPATLPYGKTLVLSIPGAGPVPAAELTFLRVPPTFTVTEPDLAGVTTIPKTAPWTVRWTPFAAELFIVRFTSGHVCKADPMAGMITVPAAVLQAQTGAGEPTIEFSAITLASSPLTVSGASRQIDMRGVVTTRYIPTYQ